MDRAAKDDATAERQKAYRRYLESQQSFGRQVPLLQGF